MKLTVVQCGVIDSIQYAIHKGEILTVPIISATALLLKLCCHVSVAIFQSIM